MGFFTQDELVVKRPVDGVELKALSGERMTMAIYKLSPGTQIPEHSHPHEQIGIVLEGEVEVTIQGETRIVKEGEPYLVPPDVPHYGKCGNRPARIIEVFSPPREDMK